MSGLHVSRYHLISLTLLLILLVLSSHAESLELWTAGMPELPPEAVQTTTRRVVTHRNGHETVAASRLYDRLTNVGDRRVLRDVYDERGRFLWTTEFIRENNRLVTVRATDEEAIRWEIRFEYDSAGRIIKEAYTSATGETQRAVAYDYSRDQTEIVSYRGEGTVAWRRRETTNGIQDERETTYFYADGSRVKTIVASIDDRDRVTREEHRDEIGAVYRSVSRDYDDDRLIREVVRDDTGAIIRLTERDYDERGLLIAETVSLPHDSVVERLSVTYEFNQRGHWTRQTHTTTAELPEERPIITDRYILEREVEYR